MSSASSSAQPAPKERNKYQSPPPPSSSMTPPPSSRAPHLFHHIPARTPTPSQSHLSSPPPTIKTPPPGPVVEPGTPICLAEDSKDALAKDVHSMLADKTSECRALKASAAHYRLQYELLTMEFSETTNRFEVELDMAQREVEVLQRTRTHRASETSWPPPKATPVLPSSPDNKVAELKDIIHNLEIENTSLRHRLSDAKLVILERESVLAEENELLRQRIRENREHFNRLRQAGAIVGDDRILGSTYLASQGSQFNSPSKGRDVEPFAALLLADQVLSQEAATTPSTPVSKPTKRNRAAHVRGSHSISSLPSTPFRSASGIAARKAAAGHYTHPQPASSPLRNAPTSRHGQRRHASRDSTISASDAEELSPQVLEDDERVLDSEGEPHVTSPSLTDDDTAKDVYASQASQEAASMLRKSSSFPRQRGTPARQDHPKSGRTGASSPTPMSRGANKAAKLSQSKLYGYHVAKPGVKGAAEAANKRFYDEGGRGEGNGEAFSPSKKAKSRGTGAEAARVGLGIDTWAGPSR